MGLFDFFKKGKSGQNIFISDKADYHYESAVAEYCKINGKRRTDLNLDNMDPEEDSIIWEYAGNHIAFFLTWIVQNDFYNAEMFEPEEIKLLQDEKISGADFLNVHCDSKFVRKFMDADILGFIDYYYAKYYFNDYCAFIEKEMKETVFGIRFSWDMFHQFVPVLDHAYREYQEKN